jgi:hypothetical protein
MLLLEELLSSLIRKDIYTRNNEKTIRKNTTVRHVSARIEHN